LDEQEQEQEQELEQEQVQEQDTAGAIGPQPTGRRNQNAEECGTRVHRTMDGS
jgi:hypothetical protein